MDILKEYDIFHVALNLGEYDYKFYINTEFFKAFNSEINEGLIDVDVCLEKTSNVSYRLFLNLNGWVKSNCGRCEIVYQLPVRIEKIVPIKITDKDFEDDEVLIINSQDYCIELAQLFYELIVLELPMVAIPCEIQNDLSLCNKDVIERLKSITPKEKEITDPRWEGLKQFLNK